MSPQPAAAAAATPTATEDDAAFHRDALRALVALGTELARDIAAARRAEPPAITAAEAAEAFERVARATRRTVLLAVRLAEQPRPGLRPDLHAARRQVIRTVEDAIHAEPRAPAPEHKRALEAEFHERLDAPELAEDLASRPVAAVIADILNDMDLGRLSLAAIPPFRRRTPAAIRRLHALARGEAAPEAPDDPPPPPPPPPPLPPPPPPSPPARDPDRARLALLLARVGKPPARPGG